MLGLDQMTAWGCCGTRDELPGFALADDIYIYIYCSCIWYSYVLAFPRRLLVLLSILGGLPASLGHCEVHESFKHLAQSQDLAYHHVFMKMHVQRDLGMGLVRLRLFGKRKTMQSSTNSQKTLELDGQSAKTTSKPIFVLKVMFFVLFVWGVWGCTTFALPLRLSLKVRRLAAARRKKRMDQ